jgi:hypothetical protein
MRLAVALMAMLGLATGCYSVCQFDREEEARNRREFLMDPEHIHDPVAFHASDQPEGLDPPGPRPLVGPRRDPDTVPREPRPRDSQYDRAMDAWETLEKDRKLEER